MFGSTICGANSIVQKLDTRQDKYIEKIIKENMRVVSAVFLYTEISAYFRNWEIMQRIIKEGFGYREFSNLRRQKAYRTLTDDQREKINTYVRDLVDKVIIKADDVEVCGHIDLKN
jgi:hypothetical protein